MENKEQNNEAGLNWYQIISIIFITLYSLIPIFMLLEEEIEFTFITFVAYSLVGVVSFMFMYGFGKIISLLTQINSNLINKPTNIVSQPTKKVTNQTKTVNDKNNENDDLPWELREE